ncbi:MAG: hypothetical protein BV459_00300 [Thermoplasmata archaeon M11B2D]|nr:MAG: hypothetical protein BV459_00300 [Thermoplasmata archaeon M11B2D]
MTGNEDFEKKIEQLHKDIEKDLKIDDVQLDYESLRTPSLHNKYFRLLTVEAMRLKKIESECNKIFKERTDYYCGRAPADVYKQSPFNHKVLKQELDTYLDADEQYCAAKEKYEEQKQVVTYLENTVKEINRRNWAIRNAIEWRRFTNGG